ncbi:hypothetical protein CR513_62540, partial [Mucuna pruriens]
MLTGREIKVNTKKCQTIISMRSPKSIKEVQQLARRIIKRYSLSSIAYQRVKDFFGQMNAKPPSKG